MMTIKEAVALLSDFIKPIDLTGVKWRSERLGAAPRCAYRACDSVLDAHSERVVLHDNGGYRASFCGACARRFFSIVIPLRKGV